MIGNPKLKEFTLPALTNVTGGALINGDFDKCVYQSRSPLENVTLSKKEKRQTLTRITRIHLPNLKTVAYLNIESTGGLDCVGLGKNLSSLGFTPPKYYFGNNPGFTCRARFGESTYNSSDPDARATSSGSESSGGSTSTLGSSAASSTSGAANPSSTT